MPVHEIIVVCPICKTETVLVVTAFDDPHPNPIVEIRNACEHMEHAIRPA